MNNDFPLLTRKEHLQYLVMYAILAAAYSWQLILNFDKTGVGDALLQPHYYWWVKTALTSLQNPYYTNYFFFPQGANLAFGFGMVPDAILMLPITAIFGANQAVNCSYIIGYLLSGYFTFLLCHDLTGNKKASFIGGFIFAFIPFHVNHVPNQIILASYQWVPFYFFLFRRALLSEKKKWAVFAGLAMALIILTDQTQAILSVIATGLLIIILWGNRLMTNVNKASLLPDSKETALKLFIMVLAAATVASFYLVPAVDFLLSGTSALKISPFERGGANQYGADLLGFIVPPSYNPIWGRLFKAVGNNNYFLGFVPLILAIIGAKNYLRSTAVKTVLIMTIVAFILSLGITLTFNGQWQWNGKHISLPYYYLNNLPPLSLIRTPFKFHLLTILGVAILASFGATHLTLIKSKKWAGMLIPILVIGLMFEFLPKTEKFEVAGPVPKIYQEMAKDKEAYSVLILPLSRWTSLVKNGSGSPSSLMYYQSVHGKKIFNGFSSRVGDESLDFGNAILDSFKDVSTYDNYEIHVFGKRSASESELIMAKEMATKFVSGRDKFIKDNNIRYIVIHNPISHEGSMTRLFVETFLEQPMNYDPAENVAYIRIGGNSKEARR